MDQTIDHVVKTQLEACMWNLFVQANNKRAKYILITLLESFLKENERKRGISLIKSAAHSLLTETQYGFFERFVNTNTKTSRFGEELENGSDLVASLESLHARISALETTQHPRPTI